MCLQLATFNEKDCHALDPSVTDISRNIECRLFGILLIKPQDNLLLLLTTCTGDKSAMCSIHYDYFARGRYDCSQSQNGDIYRYESCSRLSGNEVA